MAGCAHGVAQVTRYKAAGAGAERPKKKTRAVLAHGKSRSLGEVETTAVIVHEPVLKRTVRRAYRTMRCAERAETT